jgi:hypothetical protein
VMLQVAVPVHAPDQPVKVLLAVGTSLSVTWVFCVKLAEQVVGQLIPAGVLATVPVPVPASVTVTASLMTDAGLKVAVTESVAVRVTLQVAAPVHAPPQPAKALLVPGVSLSVIWVFGGKLAEQVVGQLIPAGLLVTVPVPAPAMVTVIASLGAVLVPLRPTQPTSTRLDRTDNGVNQNVYRNFIGELLLSESEVR